MNLLKLNVLGKFEARLPSSVVISLPTRKSEALLTYLAMSPGERHTRDQLAGLFWSDRGEDQSRNSLRQSLSAIKKSLGSIDPSPLVIEHNEVSIVPNVIDVDALEMAQLIDDNSPQSVVRAAGLYKGEFLEGLVIRDPVAEQWLANERGQYHLMSVVALENLLAHQIATGEMRHATETGEKLVNLDPLRESAWRQLMQAYAVMGERNHALMAYKRCASILRKNLDIEPSQETTEIHVAIREGHIDAAPVSMSPEVGTSLNQSPLHSEGISSATGKPSVVVVPLTSIGAESRDDYFADGLTEDIIANLSRYRELFVIDHHSAFEYRDGKTDISKIAHELGVEYVVRGSIRHSGNQIRISGQLIEAATGKTIWAEHMDRKFDDLFTLEDEVAAKIASSLVSHIEDESRVRAARKHPDNMTAFDYVIRARQNADSYDPELNASGRRLLERAIELDPEYAAAYACLASSWCVEVDAPWCTSRQEALERAIDCARKAVDLDGFDSNAHVAMGTAYLYQKKFDLAEVHLNRAIECNPNEYGAFCVKSWLLALSGRASEVMICGTTALRLNPLAPDDCLMAIITAHYIEGQYDAALEMLDRIQHTNEYSEAWKAACFAQLGHDDEARFAAAKAAEFGGKYIQQQEWLQSWPFKNSQDLVHLVDGLNKAGVLSDSSRESEK